MKWRRSFINTSVALCRGMIMSRMAFYWRSSASVNVLSKALVRVVSQLILYSYLGPHKLNHLFLRPSRFFFFWPLFNMIMAIFKINISSPEEVRYGHMTGFVYEYHSTLDSGYVYRIAGYFRGFANSSRKVISQMEIQLYWNSASSHIAYLQDFNFRGRAVRSRNINASKITRYTVSFKKYTKIMLVDCWGYADVK